MEFIGDMGLPVAEIVCFSPVFNFLVSKKLDFRMNYRNFRFVKFQIKAVVDVIELLEVALLGGRGGKQATVLGEGLAYGVWN